MNSIFVRIYGGMIAASLILVIVFYLVFQTINFFREQYFIEDIVRGPMHVMKETFDGLPLDEQKQLLERLRRVFDTDIQIANAESLALKKSVIKDLESGSLKIRFNYDDKSVTSVIQLGGDDRYLSLNAQQITESQAQGIALVLAMRLSLTPLDQWNQEIERMNTLFTFPIARVPPHQIMLNESQKNRLFKQRQPVASFIDQRGRGTLVKSMMLLPPTGEVLLLGPQELFDWYPLGLLVFLFLGAILLLGFAVYWLVTPLDRQLTRIEKAVLRIHGGDLDARAPAEGGPKAIARLTGAINGMANHIQRLISSQKELTRAVSHELRTPVARIRFGLEMVADEDQESLRRRALDDIDEDIEQLDRLIDEILTYSKLEEGTPVLDFSMIDVHQLLLQIVRETNALGKDITITYVPPDYVSERYEAEGEERYVHRVVQNYVGNALRYATSEIRISYSVVGDIFIINVEDDGPGISADDRARVFQPFTRLDDSRTRASGGYGLGLSIVSRIAFWHGGKVKAAESEHLGGSKFTFMWPRLQSMRERG